MIYKQLPYTGDSLVFPLKRPAPCRGEWALNQDGPLYVYCFMLHVVYFYLFFVLLADALVQSDVQQESVFT